MKIQVLGSGCLKCNNLAEAAESVAKELELDFTLEKVTDINQISSFGVVMTPALVVDGDIKCVGKVPSKDELKNILSE
jgi:small redox-active disulfide protein 2